MKYIDEFRNKNLVMHIAGQIRDSMPAAEIKIMEVCGTHTHNFFRFGLHKLLPEGLRLISGPGCPVCVSHQSYIDRAIALSENRNVLIATFGDMLRVPGSSSSLEKEKARFGNIRVVYSPLDALQIARANSAKEVVFLGIGFETTAPTIAASILLAKKEKLKNLSFLCSLKTMPAAMAALMKDKRLGLDGFLCPGHVSAIIGVAPYAFIPRRYGIGCSIAGFEPLDIMKGLYSLLRQVVDKKPRVDNQYGRVVRPAGNRKAVRTIYRVFSPCAAQWRGLGLIPQSGLCIRKEYRQFDAQQRFSCRRLPAASPVSKKCRCAEVLKGLIGPLQCALFMKACTPDHPIGPCMVSTEGTCNAYYRYH
jgi:hydrogenase expression/formation protein HypD